MKKEFKNFSSFQTRIFIICGVLVLGLILALVLFSNQSETKLAYQIEQPDLYSGPLIIKTFKNTFSIKPVNAQENVQKIVDEKNPNVIKYIDAYQNTDVVQTRQVNKLKEDIILKQPGHPEKFEYQLDLEKYEFQKDGQGNFIFYEKGKKGQELYKIFTIPAPYLIDVDGKKSSTQDVEMSLENNILTLIPDQAWLDSHEYPIILDPTIEITILNIHSHPQAGDNWEVEFTTQGQADLYIISNDQVTIDDLDFVSLKCGDEQMIPQILENDVIYYPDWQCGQIGKIVHLVNVVGTHTLRFEFGDQIAYAFNSLLPTGEPEIISKRTATSRHYQIDDNNIKATIGIAPMNYKQNGEWLPVSDQAIMRSNNRDSFSKLSMDNGKLRMRVGNTPNTLGQDLVEVSRLIDFEGGDEEYWFTLQLDDVDVVTNQWIQDSPGTLFYSEIIEDVDLLLESNSKGLFQYKLIVKSINGLDNILDSNNETRLKLLFDEDLMDFTDDFRLIDKNNGSEIFKFHQPFVILVEDDEMESIMRNDIIDYQFTREMVGNKTFVILRKKILNKSILINHLNQGKNIIIDPSATIQPDASVGKDAMFFGNYQASGIDYWLRNYGVKVNLGLNAGSGYSPRDWGYANVLFFETSAYSGISNAVITLYGYNTSGWDGPVEFLRLLRTDWEEGTLDGVAGDEMNGQYYKSGSQWTGWCGANCSTYTLKNDSDASTSDAVTTTFYHGVGLTTSATITNLIDSNGDYNLSLHPLYLGDYPFGYLCSSDHATSSYRPKLVITYTSSPGDWVSPTGYNDPGGAWSNETLAYDGNTGTAAQEGGWCGQQWLELTHSALSCDKVRVYSDGYGPPCYSLAEGTLITLANGEEKFIEDLKVGDDLLSWDEGFASAQVVSIGNRDNAEYIIINDVLKTTPCHIIWSNGEFKKASEIRIGDSLLNINGEEIFVNTISYPENSSKVYSMALTSPHTYFADGCLVHNEDRDLDVDVYYSGDWHNIYSGNLNSDEWVEIGIGSTETVTAARIRNGSSYDYIAFFEFEFNSISLTSVPTVTTQSASSVNTTTATASGFKYGLTEADTWSVSENGTYGTGAYSLGLSSLTKGTTYYVRSYAVNSEGTAYGAYVPFVTDVESHPVIFKENSIFKENVIFGTYKHRVFVTSATHDGDFATGYADGLSGADAFCQGLADTEGLSGTWTAWLSTDSVDARDRITGDAYYLVDETTKICNDLNDLTDGSIQHAINQYETGNTAPLALVWTGTTSSGVESTYDCTNWSTDLPGPSDTGSTGYSTYTTGSWTNCYVNSGCNNSYYIYCFEN